MVFEFGKYLSELLNCFCNYLNIKYLCVRNLYGKVHVVCSLIQQARLDQLVIEVPEAPPDQPVPQDHVV